MNLSDTVLWTLIAIQAVLVAFIYLLPYWVKKDRIRVSPELMGVIMGTLWAFSIAIMIIVLTN